MGEDDLDDLFSCVGRESLKEPDGSSHHIAPNAYELENPATVGHIFLDDLLQLSQGLGLVETTRKHFHRLAHVVVSCLSPQVALDRLQQLLGLVGERAHRPEAESHRSHRESCRASLDLGRGVHTLNFEITHYHKFYRLGFTRELFHRKI